MYGVHACTIKLLPLQKSPHGKSQTEAWTFIRSLPGLGMQKLSTNWGQESAWHMVLPVIVFLGILLVILASLTCFMIGVFPLSVGSFVVTVALTLSDGQGSLQTAPAGLGAFVVLLLQSLTSYRLSFVGLCAGRWMSSKSVSDAGLQWCCWNLRRCPAGGISWDTHIQHSVKEHLSQPTNHDSLICGAGT